MIHKQNGLAKIHQDHTPFNSYETKCGIHANYDQVAFLWTNVSCKRCLVFMPATVKRRVIDIGSNERKEAIIKVYKELQKLRFNMPQMVAAMRQLNMTTQTGREITLKNLESFLGRNNL